jgi:hypothetical protein
MAATIASRSASHGVPLMPTSVPKPSSVSVVRHTNVPSMKRSPCAKLISSMIPYTRV